MTIIIVLGFLIICALIYELVHIGVDGKWIGAETRNIIELGLDRSYNRLNRFDEDILMGNLDVPYIARTKSITSAYHVEDIGMVPRFTSLSRAIGRKFKEFEDAESKRERAIKAFKQ